MKRREQIGEVGITAQEGTTEKCFSFCLCDQGPEYATMSVKHIVERGKSGLGRTKMNCAKQSVIVNYLYGSHACTEAK